MLIKSNLHQISFVEAFIDGKYQAINVCFYSSRGENNPTEERKADVESFILDKIEDLLPGFNTSILFKKYLSPKEFEEKWLVSW